MYPEISLRRVVVSFYLPIFLQALHYACLVFYLTCFLVGACERRGDGLFPRGSTRQQPSPATTKTLERQGEK